MQPMFTIANTGTKINIISKCNIRYEGELHSINSEERSIILTNVRAFGTEGRDAPFQIPPDRLIHHCVIFESTDIKDIKVVKINISNPTEAAITQVQLMNYIKQHITSESGSTAENNSNNQ